MAHFEREKNMKYVKEEIKKMGKKFVDALCEIKTGYNRMIDEYGCDGINSIKSLKEKSFNFKHEEV